MGVRMSGRAGGGVDLGLASQILAAQLDQPLGHPVTLGKQLHQSQGLGLVGNIKCLQRERTLALDCHADLMMAISAGRAP